jgi:hypothetical protein
MPYAPPILQRLQCKSGDRTCSPTLSESAGHGPTNLVPGTGGAVRPCAIIAAMGKPVWSRQPAGFRTQSTGTSQASRPTASPLHYMACWRGDVERAHVDFRRCEPGARVRRPHAPAYPPAGTGCTRRRSVPLSPVWRARPVVHPVAGLDHPTDRADRARDRLRADAAPDLHASRARHAGPDRPGRLDRLPVHIPAAAAGQHLVLLSRNGADDVLYLQPARYAVRLRWWSTRSCW